MVMKNIKLRKEKFITLGIVLGMLVSLSSSIVFSTLFSEYIPLNIPNSIGELLKNENEEETNCVIYPHKLVNIDVMTYHMPERTTKMRDLYPEQHFLDVYQSDWAGLYSPGSIQYEQGGPKNNISFLLMPKDTYIRSNWFYDDGFEFIYPTENPIKAHNAPNEIYITKKYADYLISQTKGIDDGDYAALIKEPNTYNIPYQWSFKNGEKIASPQYFNVYYKISGILNENCEAYQNYKKLYGDFFIANELLDLPIPCITTFNISKNNKYAKNVFKVALNTFKYESKSSAINQSVGNMHFEYRISFFKEMSSESKINNIDIAPSEIQKKTDNLFEKFCYKDHILRLVIFALFFFVSMFIFIYCSIMYSKHERIIYMGKIKYSLFSLLTISLSVVISNLILKRINKLPSFIGLSQFNTISAIASISILLIYLILILLRFVTSRKIKPSK